MAKRIATGSIVENKRCASGKVVQRHVLYLGEINDQHKPKPGRSPSTSSTGTSKARAVARLVSRKSCVVELGDTEIVRIKLSELQLRRPRQWGACWLTCHLYEELQLDRLLGASGCKPGRKGTRWDLVLQTLVLTD